MAGGASPAKGSCTKCRAHSGRAKRVETQEVHMEKFSLLRADEPGGKKRTGRLNDANNNGDFGHQLGGAVIYPDDPESGPLLHIKTQTRTPRGLRWTAIVLDEYQNEVAKAS